MSANSTDLLSHIENAAHSGAFGTNPLPSPTAAQCAAGNYKVGRLDLYGLKIAIEQPRGTYRHGIGTDGQPWTSRMAAHYGYVNGTRGADGDPVDCFVGVYPQSETAYVANQFINGRFDEHKLLLAFPDEASARRAYLDSYERGWTGLHSLVPASLTQLRWWLKHGNLTQPLRPEHLPFDGLETMTQRTYWDGRAMPEGTTLDRVLYDLRRADEDGLIFDAVRVADILEDSDGLLTLDALVTPYATLERKMEVLRGVMERTGGTVKPVALQIPEPFTQRGVANVAAVFELSDGQTVSVFFHNPDTTPKKLQPTDEMISWKWLLNKKDITIVVAPEKGEDLNVREVARRIMKLAEKNSAAFQRANGKRAERMQRIEDLKTEIAQLETERDELLHELEVAKVEAEGISRPEPTPEPAIAASMSSNEIPANKGNAHEYRKAAFDMIRARYGSRPPVPVTTQEGSIVLVGMGGLKHVLKDGLPSWQEAVATLHAEEIIAKADYLGSEPDYKKRAEIKAVHRYGASIEIDGEKYGVVVVVMEASDGKRYYDHTVTGKDESPAGLLADPSTTEVDEESGRPFTGLPDEPNITQSPAKSTDQPESSTAPTDIQAKIQKLALLSGRTVAATQTAYDKQVAQSGEPAAMEMLDKSLARYADAEKYAAMPDDITQLDLTTTEGLARAIQVQVAKDRNATLLKKNEDDLAQGYLSPERYQYEKDLVAEQYQQEITSPLPPTFVELAHAIVDKDPIYLISRFVYGDFEASEKVFALATGVRLQRLSKDAKTKALFAWAGWSQAQIDAWTAQREAEIAVGEEKRIQARKESSLKDTWRMLGYAKVRTEAGVISTQEFVKSMPAAGHNQVVAQKAGASTAYRVQNESGLAMGLGTRGSAEFNNFLKAVLNYNGGDLRQALEFLGAIEPAAEPSVDPIARVDAAYRFADATDEFKRWLANYLDKPEYSPFLTAKAMDEAAKANGATIAWGDFGPIRLDAVGGDDIVGLVKKDGAVVGRIQLYEDGKAMVFVGEIGKQRVKFTSGTEALWSDDDAPLMVTALLTVEQSAPVMTAGFSTLEEANAWIESRASAYGGKLTFYASDEYKQAYPRIKALADAENQAASAHQKALLEEAGLKPGDRVYSYASGMLGLGGSRVTGTLALRAGMPVVKTDIPQTVNRNGKLSTSSTLPWSPIWRQEGTEDNPLTLRLAAERKAQEAIAAKADRQRDEQWRNEMDARNATIAEAVSRGYDATGAQLGDVVEWFEDGALYFVSEIDETGGLYHTPFESPQEGGSSFNPQGYRIRKDLIPPEGAVIRQGQYPNHQDRMMMGGQWVPVVWNDTEDQYVPVGATPETAAPAEATQADANRALKALAGFIGPSQLSAVKTAMRGEERQFFFDKLVELARVVETMPQTYDQDGLGDSAVAYLHYFKGNADWYITEKDREPEQLQAFGLADLGYGGELGYISLVELTAAGAELDFYWQPKTLGEIKGKKEAEKPAVTIAEVGAELERRGWTRSGETIWTVSAEQNPAFVAAGQYLASGSLDDNGKPYFMLSRYDQGAWVPIQKPSIAVGNSSAKSVANLIESDIADVAAELQSSAAPPEPETITTPDAEAPNAADRAYLQSLIDGTVADILAPEISVKLEALYRTYAEDPAMVDLLNRAITAYSEAMMGAANAAMTH